MIEQGRSVCEAVGLKQPSPEQDRLTGEGGGICERARLRER